jgi:hypothetical protein
MKNLIRALLTCSKFAKKSNVLIIRIPHWVIFTLIRQKQMTEQKRAKCELTFFVRTKIVLLLLKIILRQLFPSLRWANVSRL